jgi:hypothetical protein
MQSDKFLSSCIGHLFFLSLSFTDQLVDRHRIFLIPCIAAAPRGRLHVYDFVYDSVYDFLHKVVCNLVFNRFFLLCVDKQL